LSIFDDVRGSKELFVNLTMREVKGKYKRTALGQLWSLANPIAQMIVYSFVFAFVIKVQPDPGDPSGLNIFVVWLMCALLPWTFLTGVISGGMSTIVGNENLIKKVWFPRSILIFSNTAAAGYQWLWEMGILLVVMFIVGANPLAQLPVLLLTMMLLALFATGLAMLFSIANVYFRDVQHFVGILFQFWFYASPIVYPVSLVRTQSDNVGPLIGSIEIIDIYNLNPFVHFAEFFRNCLYDNRFPDWSTFGLIAALSIGVFFAGWYVFDKHQDRLAEAL